MNPCLFSFSSSIPQDDPHLFPPSGSTQQLPSIASSTGLQHIKGSNQIPQSNPQTTFHSTLYDSYEMKPVEEVGARVHSASDNIQIKIQMQDPEPLEFTFAVPKASLEGTRVTDLSTTIAEFCAHSYVTCFLLKSNSSLLDPHTLLVLIYSNAK
jgi:hypothetical protein